MSSGGAIPVQRIGTTLLVTVHVELDDRLAEDLQRSVLRAIERGGTPGLLVDISGLEMVDTENLRPHYARTLWNWSDALEAKLDDARQVLARDGGDDRAEKTLRAYRLYLAGSAMSFEQGWISLHQMLAARPSGDVHDTTVAGAQSSYPFNRDYMYTPVQVD